MKKLLLAILTGFVGIASAHWGSCGPGCGPVDSCGTGAYMSAPAAAPAMPVCTRTYKVPVTHYETRIAEVAPIRVEKPQAPLLRQVPQPDVMVRYPQPPIQRPDIVCRVPQPCKWECVPQPNIVTYVCPLGTNENNACAPACANPCA